MTEPTVSVVVTCYNYGHFLADCLDSVLAQTWDDYEVIVIDDGSTDDTARIASGYADGVRVRYHRRENGGQARAKNDGVRLARGKYVAFIDADDAWEPDKLARQIRLLEADTGVGVVYTRSRHVDADGRARPQGVPGRFLVPRRGDVTRWLVFDNFVPFSSSVVRRELFERLGGFDESLAMAIDWDLWLRISLEARFDFVDAALMRYRVGHSGQMSRNRERRQTCCDRIMASFVERNPDVVSASMLQRARAYTWASRGRYFEGHDRGRAWRCYLRSLRHHPMQWSAIKGCVRLSIGRLPGEHA